ncbi:MAG: DUF4332 domain-containing protein [Bacteroidota bacterium]
MITQADWDYVKKTSLWPYEELIGKLQALSAYPVLWGAYNHDMARAARFAGALFPNRDIAAGEFPASVMETMSFLEKGGIRNWGDLLDRVATRESGAAFVASTGLGFRRLADVLTYLLRWGFPYRTASREIFAQDDPHEMETYAALKQHGLMNTFDLLEAGRTADGRGALARSLGLPLEFSTALVHRADIARLPFVRRKTILAVCGAGYDSLAKIAHADTAGMESALDEYFRRTQGKPWENFKSVIVPRGMIAAAQALPPILDQPV